MPQPRVLIVEDEIIIARDLAGQLAAAGYDVVGQATRGSEALRIAQEMQPDLVIMDIKLKGEMDGIETAGRICSTLDLPIVYLTAHTEKDLFERARTTEPFAYLTKPVSPHELVRVIELALYKHRMERRLKESEERFRLLFRNAPLGYQALDEEGNFLEVNQAWLDTFGYDREEVIGTWFGDLVAPGHVDRFRQSFSRFKATGETHGVEHEMMCKDGSRITVSFDGKISHDDRGRFLQTHCILQDITVKRGLEEALSAERERLDVTLRSIGDGVISTDVSGRVLSVNTAAEELTGWTEKEAIGQPLEAVFHIVNEFTRERCEDPVRKVLRTGQVVGLANHTMLISRDGTERILADSGAPIRGRDGIVKGVVLVFRDVTEGRKAEVTLRESEERFRALYNHTPAMLHSIDTHGCLVSVSEEWLRALGYDRNEVIGKPSAEFLTDESREYARTEVLPEFFRTGVCRDIPYRFVKKNGEIIDVLLSATSERDAKGEVVRSLAVLNEVTERKKAELALRESEERYRAIFNNAAFGVALAGPDLHFQQVNAAFSELLGYGPEELQRLTVAEITHPDDREESKQIMAALVRGDVQGVRLEKRYLRNNGEILWGDVSISAFRDVEGKFQAAIAVIADRTEHRKAQELFLRSERLAALAELSADVSHNFNNVLQIVVGGARMALSHLQSGDLTTVRTQLEQVFSSALSGVETVKRLRAFSRCAAHPKIDGAKVFDLSEAVAQAVEVSEPWWKSRAEKRGIEIAMHRDLQKGCMIKGIPNELFEVVVNLVKNAVDALPQGGAIWVGTRTVDETVILDVRDNGVGIPEEHLSRVFAPFWTSKGTAGTGMGLASAYGIVRRHGGEIRVESTEGAGATFTVTLPRKDAAS
jgi:PAS domain S-box-containing protein